MTVHGMISALNLYHESLIVGLLNNTTPTQSDRSRSLLMVDCCVIHFAPLFMSEGDLFVHLPPEKVFTVVLEPKKGCCHPIAVTTSVRMYPQAACRLVLGLGKDNLPINGKKGEKSPHFDRTARACGIGVWVSNTTLNPTPPAKIALPTHLIVV